VYSTCTLSPVQNDGIIQATLEQVWQKTQINVTVVDTGHVADRCREMFNFADNTRFGQLVLPNLTANFGPMYFCKLKRLT
jgi:16S rRNA C967 or C1407 C5-methylase (RsmB/RsmF family)